MPSAWWFVQIRKNCTGSANSRLSMHRCTPYTKQQEKWETNLVIESLRLEKSTKITSTHPHRAHWPHPSVPHPHGPSAPSGTVTPPPSWAAVSPHHHSLWEEIIPNIQPEPPLNLSLNLRPSPLILSQDGMWFDPPGWVFRSEDWIWDTHRRMLECLNGFLGTVCTIT